MDDNEFDLGLRFRTALCCITHRKPESHQNSLADMYDAIVGRVDFHSPSAQRSDVVARVHTAVLNDCLPGFWSRLLWNARPSGFAALPKGVFNIILNYGIETCVVERARLEIVKRLRQSDIVVLSVNPVDYETPEFFDCDKTVSRLRRIPNRA